MQNDFENTLCEINLGRERTSATAAVEEQRHAPPRTRAVRLVRCYRVVKRLPTRARI